MQYRSGYHLLAGMLLASIVVLIASFVYLQQPVSAPVRLNTTLLQTIPQDIILAVGPQVFSTSSASLMSEKSTQDFAQLPSTSEKLSAFFFPTKKTPVSPLDEKLLENWLLEVNNQIKTASSSPKVVWKSKNVFTIDPGKQGVEIDIAETKKDLFKTDFTATNSATAVITLTGKALTPDGIIESERFVRKFLGKKLTLQQKYFHYTLSATELVGLLDLPTDFSEESFSALIDKLRPNVETKPIEPTLQINGPVVESFVAPKEGVAIDEKSFATQLASALRMLADTSKQPAVEIPLIMSAPKTTLASTNSIGITEKLGVGESAYAHSIPNRIHNVSHTTARIHAKLIMPGEEFSFNKYLGDVSAKTGFKQAYIIKEGQTILGDGGGVCQVSSTLFRALLNAGLPITERKGHSYRVGYYEQNSRPGFDATVYDPHPDLRFVNDTDAPILINAVADPKTTSMYVELWGKSDGRKAEVKNYKQWGAQPAPPPRYQEDPTLKPGQVKQVEYAAPGLKTSFDYVVTYPTGEVKEKTFSTSYIPWAAVYLRGI